MQFEKPIFLLTANRRVRRFLRITFGLLGVLFLITGVFYVAALLFLSLYFFGWVFFIRDKELRIYEDRVELLRTSLLENLNITETFFYKDLKKVKFDKGFTNIVGAFLENRIYFKSTNASTDTIHFERKDSSFRVINRFGSKEDFQYAAAHISNLFKSWGVRQADM